MHFPHAAAGMAVLARCYQRAQLSILKLQPHLCLSVSSSRASVRTRDVTCCFHKTHPDLATKSESGDSWWVCLVTVSVNPKNRVAVWSFKTQKMNQQFSTFSSLPSKWMFLLEWVLGWRHRLTQDREVFKVWSYHLKHMLYSTWEFQICVCVCEM